MVKGIDIDTLDEANNCDAIESTGVMKRSSRICSHQYDSNS